MKQTLHIFAKDARRSWRDIALVAAWFAAYAAIPPGEGRSARLPLATLFACWKLAASAVQEDGPAKESPFRVTRPYGRGNLIAAKSERVIANLRRKLVYRGLGRRTSNPAWGAPPKE